MALQDRAVDRHFFPRLHDDDAAGADLFYYTPLLKEISRGWVIILCAVGVSALLAWKFPVKTEVREAPEEEDAP